MISTKKILSLAVALAFVLSFTIHTTRNAEAATGMPFGGLNLMMWPCTCTASMMWHFFSPLYNPKGPVTGALIAYPSSITFRHYYLHPSAWALGTYTPGAGICYVGVAPYCYAMPNLGLIIPPTGTSP